MSSSSSSAPYESGDPSQSRQPTSPLSAPASDWTNSDVASSSDISSLDQSEIDSALDRSDVDYVLVDDGEIRSTTSSGSGMDGSPAPPRSSLPATFTSLNDQAVLPRLVSRSTSPSPPLATSASQYSMMGDSTVTPSSTTSESTTPADSHAHIGQPYYPAPSASQLRFPDPLRSDYSEAPATPNRNVKQSSLVAASAFPESKSSLSSTSPTFRHSDVLFSDSPDSSFAFMSDYSGVDSGAPDTYIRRTLRNPWCPAPSHQASERSASDVDKVTDVEGEYSISLPSQPSTQEILTASSDASAPDDWAHYPDGAEAHISRSRESQPKTLDSHLTSSVPETKVAPLPIQHVSTETANTKPTKLPQECKLLVAYLGVRPPSTIFQQVTTELRYAISDAAEDSTPFETDSIGLRKPITTSSTKRYGRDATFELREADYTVAATSTVASGIPLASFDNAAALLVVFIENSNVYPSSLAAQLVGCIKGRARVSTLLPIMWTQESAESFQLGDAHQTLVHAVKLGADLARANKHWDEVLNNVESSLEGRELYSHAKPQWWKYEPEANGHVVLYDAFVRNEYAVPGSSRTGKTPWIVDVVEAANTAKAGVIDAVSSSIHIPPVQAPTPRNTLSMELGRSQHNNLTDNWLAKTRAWLKVSADEAASEKAIVLDDAANAAVASGEVPLSSKKPPRLGFSRKAQALPARRLAALSGRRFPLDVSFTLIGLIASILGAALYIAFGRSTLVPAMGKSAELERRQIPAVQMPLESKSSFESASALSSAVQRVLALPYIDRSFSYVSGDGSRSNDATIPVAASPTVSTAVSKVIPLATKSTLAKPVSTTPPARKLERVDLRESTFRARMASSTAARTFNASARVSSGLSLCADATAATKALAVRSSHSLSAYIPSLPLPNGDDWRRRWHDGKGLHMVAIVDAFDKLLLRVQHELLPAVALLWSDWERMLYDVFVQLLDRAAEFDAHVRTVVLPAILTQARDLDSRARRSAAFLDESIKRHVAPAAVRGAMHIQMQAHLTAVAMSQGYREHIAPPLLWFGGVLETAGEKVVHSSRDGAEALSVAVRKTSQRLSASARESSDHLQRQIPVWSESASRHVNVKVRDARKGAQILGRQAEKVRTSALKAVKEDLEKGWLRTQAVWKKLQEEEHARKAARAGLKRKSKGKGKKSRGKSFDFGKGRKKTGKA